MDKFAALRAAQFDAPNFDLETEDILARLQAWDEAWGLDLVALEGDTFVVRFHRLPEDLAAFVEEEIEAFCPDVIYQLSESPEALAESIRRTRQLQLWWD